MSSSTTSDDYVGLMNPWKSIAEAAMEKVTSLHDSTENDHSIKVSHSSCIKYNQDHAQANVV